MKYLMVSIAFILVVFSSLASSESAKEIKTMKEVSIIGNAELPDTTFDLPWRLPSVDKREQQSPLKKFPGLLKPIEPFRYKQQIHFSKYLDVNTSSFNAR